jgi:hypothetical protein
VAEAVARDGLGPSARAFLDAHEGLMQGDLLGPSRKSSRGGRCHRQANTGSS